MGYIEDLKTKRQGQGRLRWRVRYRDPAGRERAKSFARKGDAERFLQHAEADKLRGQWVDPKRGRMTVGELAERWYATTVTLKPKTREDYRSLLHNHILPAFGDRAVASLDTLAVRGWLAGLVSKGLSPSRAKHAYYVLFAVLEAAIQAGALVRNPAAGVRVPRSHSREMHFLSAVEVERLAEAIVPPYGVLVRFAAYTGLRAGEIAALRVKRLDLLRGTVRVVEAASEVGGRLITGPTKTHAERTVSLPQFLRDELAAYLASRPRDRDAFVFTAPKGGPLRHHNFYKRLFARRWFARACLSRSAFMICGTPAPRCSSPRVLTRRRSKRTLGTARFRSRWTATGMYSQTPWSTWPTGSMPPAPKPGRTPSGSSRAMD